MALSLRKIVHQRYSSFIPGGFSVIHDVLSLAKDDVGEQAYTTADGHVSLQRLLLALEQPVPTFDLTGSWSADDGAYYFLNQEQNGTLWWVGLSNDPDPTVRGTPDNPHGLQCGLSFTNVFKGQIEANIIEGEWVDVPRGENLHNGRLTLNFTLASGGKPAQLQKIASSGDGYGASFWTLIGPPLQAPPGLYDVFPKIHKNDSSTLLHNLKPYKDSAVLYCVVTPDIDFPLRDQANRDIPQWHVNYPTGVDRNYADFACAVDSDNFDADLNIHIQLVTQQFDTPASASFWDQSNGWLNGHDIIQKKLNDSNNQLHIEVIMFGRTAKCGDNPITFNDAPLLPGWQEQNGNSVLLNGRPINGHVVSADLSADGRSQVPGKNEYYGVSLGDPKLPPLIGNVTRLRVTGAVILDCGHGLGTPCFDEPGSLAIESEGTFGYMLNQEIHPVYAIDIISANATSSDDLSGTWSDDNGRTFYLRQLADNTLWGLGMSPFRDQSYTRIFQGTIQDNQLITAQWADVPRGLDVFHTGSMTIQLNEPPGMRCLWADVPCRFVTWSDSPIVQRWTKLYDIPAPA